MNYQQDEDNKDKTWLVIGLLAVCLLLGGPALAVVIAALSAGCGYVC